MRLGTRAIGAAVVAMMVLLVIAGVLPSPFGVSPRVSSLLVTRPYDGSERMSATEWTAWTAGAKKCRHYQALGCTLDVVERLCSSREFDEGKRMADTHSWFDNAARHAAHASSGLRRRGDGDANHDPLADSELHPEEFEHPPEEPHLEDPAMPLAGDAPDMDPNPHAHDPQKHPQQAHKHPNDPMHDPQQHPNNPDGLDGPQNPDWPDGGVLPHLMDAYHAGDMNGVGLVQSLLDPMAPNNVFMCCCPEPYKPCTSKEINTDCASHIAALIAPHRDMAMNPDMQPLANDRRQEQETLAASIQAARMALWMEDEACTQVYSSPEPASQCNYQHPGSYHGQPDVFRVVSRQEHYCETATWKWVELGQGDPHDFRMNDCKTPPVAKNEAGSLRKDIPPQTMLEIPGIV